MARKDVDYYYRYPHQIRLKKIPKRLGGGYCATIPELGSDAFVGDGETPAEAIEDLKTIKRHILEEWQEKGVLEKLMKRKGYV